MPRPRFVLALLSLVGATGLGAARLPQSNQQSVADILALEDARGASPEHIALLLSALRLDAHTARLAVRALGRLERPALVDVLIPQLLSPDREIRLEAAGAIGQALQGSDAKKAALTVTAIDALSALLARESDFFVRGAGCETLGRLPFHSAARHRDIERLLVANTRLAAAPSGMGAFFMPGIAGAAKGLEALIRLHQKSVAPEPATIARLRELVAEPLPPSRLADGRGAGDAALRLLTRHLAMQALVTSRTVDAATIKAARSGETSATLRRLSLTALAQAEGQDLIARADALIAESARDDADAVRYEAIRLSGPRRELTGCRLLFDALDDRSPHVALLAIDLVDDRCPVDETTRRLNQLVASLSSVGGQISPGPAREAPATRAGWNSGSRLGKAAAWHAPAHAIVSLAKASPAAARKVLPAFATHGVWQVRIYAARAAAVLHDADLLEQLAVDAHDNVREAAVAALSRVRAHAADDLYLAALERPDYQLIRTAAGALEGTPQRERTAAAALQALRRLTAQRRDTSRDPRVALLQRLREVGGPAQATDLRPYLTDFDPRIAALAAELISAWTRDTVQARPQPLPLPPPPAAEELGRLRRSRAVLTMHGGGAIELRLLTDQAPLAVARFVRLASAGHYNGLTFHRVAPNFVIQGGSPGANQYMGDGPYMRDEVGASNVTGSVGISTRGRDTGDAQFYFNLIDNWRLDHDYTVFAMVERGQFTLHDIIEGDVIEKIEIIR